MIGVLPMPDGTYRGFKLSNEDEALEAMLAAWQNECREMEKDDEEV